MKTFFEDNRDIEEINKNYVGKNMAEISDIEEKRFAEVKPEIDAKHDDFIKQGRSRMLTVQKLIDYLKTQDPNACVLAYERNSNAYIEQWPDLPSADICTVAEDKRSTKKYLEHWYKKCSDAKQRIESDIADLYRYAQDSDIVIKFN